MTSLGLGGRRSPSGVDALTTEGGGVGAAAGGSPPSTLWPRDGGGTMDRRVAAAPVALTGASRDCVGAAATLGRRLPGGWMAGRKASRCVAVGRASTLCCTWVAGTACVAVDEADVAPAAGASAEGACLCLDGNVCCRGRKGRWEGTARDFLCNPLPAVLAAPPVGSKDCLPGIPVPLFAGTTPAG